MANEASDSTPPEEPNPSPLDQIQICVCVDSSDSSEEHTPPEEPNPSPLDQDKRVFALTANEDIPADDDGFLREVYQFWCNISRRPTLTQNFRLPPTQTRNIRLPPTLTRYFRLPRVRTRPSYRVSKKTEKTKEEVKERKDKNTGFGGVSEKDVVFSDLDATYNIWDLVKWIKERAVGLYAWLKGVINMYKWARWVLKNRRAVCGTLLFSAMLLRILVDILSEIEVKRSWIKFGEDMQMRQQMQRWERLDNRYVVGQGVVLGGGTGIGLLAALD